MCPMVMKCSPEPSEGRLPPSHACTMHFPSSDSVDKAWVRAWNSNDSLQAGRRKNSRSCRPRVEAMEVMAVR